MGTFVKEETSSLMRQFLEKCGGYAVVDGGFVCVYIYIYRIKNLSRKLVCPDIC